MSKRNKFGDSKMTQDNQTAQAANAPAEQENKLAAEQSTQESQVSADQAAAEQAPEVETKAPEVKAETPKAEPPAPAAQVKVEESKPPVVQAQAADHGVFEGVKISEAFQKTLSRFKDNHDALAVAKDMFAFVAKNKVGVPQTDESCANAAKQLLSKISIIYRDAQHFNDKYTMLVAVAREFDDVCFTPELMFRGAPGLSASDYPKYQAAVTLLIESAHLANPKQAAKRLDITKMMAAFGSADITNRMLAWYE